VQLSMDFICFPVTSVLISQPPPLLNRLPAGRSAFPISDSGIIRLQQKPAERIASLPAGFSYTGRETPRPLSGIRIPFSLLYFFLRIFSSPLSLDPACCIPGKRGASGFPTDAHSPPPHHPVPPDRYGQSYR